MATDPFSILEEVLGPAKGRRPKQERIVPRLPEEEVEGLLGQITGGVMSGLEFAGNVLDTPGSVVRGLLAGDPGRALGGVFSPSERVGGRELLENWGVLGQNVAGLDAGDVAGFGAEVLLDPLMLLTGPGKAIVGGGKAAKAAGKLVGSTPARFVEEIRKGERGLVGLGLPFGETKAIFGTGETAAKVADFFYYNPVSLSFRKYLDANPFLKTAGMNPVLARLADEEYAKQLDSLAQINGQIAGISNRIPDLKTAYDDILGEYGESLSLNGIEFDDFIRARAENDKVARMGELLNAMQATPEMMGKGQMLDQFAGEIKGMEDAMKASIEALGGSVKELDDLYTGHFFRRPSATIRSALAKQKRKGTRLGADFQIPRSWRDVPGGTNMINAITKDPLVSAIDHISDARLADVRNQAIEELKALGLDASVERSDEWAAEYIARKYGLRNTPKGEVTGGRQAMEALDVAKRVRGLPEEVVERGLFDRPVLLDLMDYLRAGAAYRSALGSVHRLATDVASDTAFFGETVDDAFGKIFKSKDAVERAKNAFANEMRKAGKDPETVTLPQDFVKTAQRYLTYHSNPRETEGLLRVYDTIHNSFKAGVTLPFPGFHMRNLVSGLWQNAVMLKSPVALMNAYRDTIAALRGGNDELLRAMQAYDVLPRGAIGGLEEIVSPGVEELGVRSGTKRVAGAVKGAGWFGKPFAAATATGAEISQLVEALNRGAHFAARKAEGWSDAMAARYSKLAHHDYSELSDFEKNVMKRLVPFWSYSRKNLPLQLKELINNPGGRTAQTIRLENELREREQGYIPPWLSEGFVTRLGPGKEGRQQFYSQSSGLPIEEALNRMAFSGGLPDVKRTTEKLAGQLNPLLQLPLELISGKQLWSGRDLETLHEGPTGVQGLDQLLYKSPLARVASTTRMLADPRKTALQKMANFFYGGGRVTDVDLEGAMIAEGRKIIENELRSTKGVKKFVQFYPDPEELANLSPEALEKLSLLYALNQRAKKLAQEKNTAP